MKVAFLVKDLDIKNGWGSYSFYLIEALKKENIEPIVITENIGYFKARKLVKNCQIVHSLTEPKAFLGAHLKGCRPFFITAHGTYAVEPLEKGGFRGWCLRHAYKKAEKVICISRFTEKEIKKRMPEARTVVINNGVNFEEFQRDNPLRPAYLENRYPMILSVGALKTRKGYHISIPAVAVLKEKYPNFLYIIVGDQSNTRYFEQLKNLVKNYGLENNIKFIEADDEEKINLYRAADVFLLTPVNHDSHFEGFGLVYLEAGACGVPSIGTKDCGAEDAIKDGETGFLVEQNDIIGTGNALLKILGNNEPWLTLGNNAREFAKQMSWNKAAEAVVGLYKKALERLVI
jgi:glycosyltransferase involved in cell wall biosynthesis